MHHQPQFGKNSNTSLSISSGSDASSSSSSSSDDEPSKKRPKPDDKSSSSRPTKQEKSHKEKKKQRRSSPETDSSDDDDRSSKRKEKKESNKNLSVDLGRNRLVTLSDFRGRVSVDIREYYEKDGKQLPGKKGISLTPDEWSKLKKNVSKIDAALEKRGG